MRGLSTAAMVRTSALGLLAVEFPPTDVYCTSAFNTCPGKPLPVAAPVGAPTALLTLENVQEKFKCHYQRLVDLPDIFEQIGNSLPITLCSSSTSWGCSPTSRSSSRFVQPASHAGRDRSDLRDYPRGLHDLQVVQVGSSRPSGPFHGLRDLQVVRVVIALTSWFHRFFPTSRSCKSEKVHCVTCSPAQSDPCGRTSLAVRRLLSRVHRSLGVVHRPIGSIIDLFSSSEFTDLLESLTDLLGLLILSDVKSCESERQTEVERSGLRSSETEMAN